MCAKVNLTLVDFRDNSIINFIHVHTYVYSSAGSFNVGIGSCVELQLHTKPTKPYNPIQLSDWLVGNNQET